MIQEIGLHGQTSVNASALLIVLSLRSGRAKCHGVCHGRLIPQGELRYGKMYYHNVYGESMTWMHWECAGSVLHKLASVRLEDVSGFRALRSEDQERVRRDVKAGRIGPPVVPPLPSSSQTSSSQILSSSQVSSSQIPSSQSSTSRPTSNSQSASSRKRKAEMPSHSQALIQPTPIQSVDSDEYFDNSQDEIKDELYISMSASVVGLQYYKGMVGPGEEVQLVREPHNRYDSNAIQVLNISGMQVGHIPRNISSKLAPLIDRNLVTVEALDRTLKIYGASHKRAELEPVLVWATPRQRGFTNTMRPAGYQNQSAYNVDYEHIMPPSSVAGPSRSQSSRGVSASQRKGYEAQLEATRKAAELRAIINSLEKVNDEGRRSSLLDIVCPTEVTHSYSERPTRANNSVGCSQALLWCIERENPSLPKKESDRPVQFWQYKVVPTRPKGYYLNIATKTPQEALPVLGRGGLMADAMGLGKTLTMLSLTVATKKDIPTEFSNTTLIVVPLSVLSNWKTQISEHFTPNTLTYHVYYEVGRNISAEQLSKFDIVITTYQVVVQDHSAIGGVATKVDPDSKVKKQKTASKGLFGIKWKRIILDEGHTIRNPKTKMAVGVRSLEAQRRWVVTGTPIINSPKDLGSLLQFLQICNPLDNEDYYKRLVLRPLAQGAPEGAELLRALMSHICLRRTKEMQNSKGEHLVPLPPVEMTLIPVQLDEPTRELYNEMEAISQQRFASYMENQRTPGGSGTLANVLSLLTRLRQLTLHPALIPSDYLQQLRSMSLDDSGCAPPAMPITPQDRFRLQTILARAIEDREECPICFDITNDPRITPCAHLFCLACISEVLSRDSRCPMDRRVINVSDLIEPPPPTDLTQVQPQPESEDNDSGIRTGSSAKIDQLVHLLKLTPKTEKSLVFSQFTGFLSKIGEALDEHGIPYVRFDGQMSARRRQEVLEQFSKPLKDEKARTVVAGIAPLVNRRSRSTTKILLDSDVRTPGRDDEFRPGNDSDCVDSLDDFDTEYSPTVEGKGKGKARVKVTRCDAAFDTLDDHEVNPVVMLISLKAGALGLNLTVANNHSVRMDPWWQEGIESQAIDRCNRIGQTKPVHVYQLVAENTVEAKVLEIQDRKKNLIKQAFSGMKATEMQRQKKEARLQGEVSDLVELFGARNRLQD
ncbi:SNF2 family N-terminal domain-containing protein [Hysterangium stoloniferum]|nr:SNF2 family N-terminal domain-containing protein [Hysterangium stoloniferum]